MTSGIPALDHQLKGGFRVGSVTEIYGRAGTGKTQLAMQLCVAAAAQQGLASAFIDTEGKLSLQRLQEIAVVVTVSQQANTAPGGQHPRQRNYGMSEQEQGVRDTLSRVLIYSANDADQLRSVLSAVEVEACARYDPTSEGYEMNGKPPIGVIVLDSIASPARREFGTGDAVYRAQFLMDCAKTLKRIAETLNLAVVVINQIGGTVTQLEKHGAKEETDNGAATAALETGALGNSWHHCATTRLQIECKCPTDAANRGQEREIVVMKSSLLMRGSTSLVYLGQDGFKDVAEGLFVR